MVMDPATQRELLLARRELASLRGQLNVVASQPTVPVAEFAALKTASDAYGASIQRLMHGEAWIPLTLPAGMTGSAAYRQAWGGYTELRVNAQVREQSIEIFGVILTPVQPHTFSRPGLSVTLRTDGVIEITTTETTIAGSWMFPQR